jgi:ribosomal protein L37AE/L43A
MEVNTMSKCKLCNANVHPKRVALGYDTCLSCGEVEARNRKFTVVPMHKSNYIVVSNKEDLKGINNKGGKHG